MKQVKTKPVHEARQALFNAIVRIAGDPNLEYNREELMRALTDHEQSIMNVCGVIIKDGST